MKRKISFILVLTIIFSVALSPHVFAYQIGDVIGSSLTTDIVAQINGYDIASYNYQGYTYVVAEDLANYGFSVQYDNSTRSLGVYRNYGVTNIYSSYTKPKVSSNDIGKVAYKLLYTDIATYLDGTYVNSYNIDGKTIICFNDLAGYGTINYDNNSRKLTLDIPGIAKKPASSYTANTTPAPSNQKLQRNDIEITLKPDASSVFFVNKSNAPFSFSVLCINGGLIMRPNNSSNGVVVNPGETKLVQWVYDGIFNKRGANHGLNSYGYVVIKWNGKQYYADFTVNGITTFYRGNARGPIAE